MFGISGEHPHHNQDYERAHRHRVIPGGLFWPTETIVELSGYVPNLGDLLELYGKLAAKPVNDFGLGLPRAITVRDDEQLSVIAPEGAQVQVLLAGLMGVDLAAKWDRHGQSVVATGEVASKSS